MQSAILLPNNLLRYDKFSLRQLSLQQGRLYLEAAMRSYVMSEQRDVIVPSSYWCELGALLLELLLPLENSQMEICWILVAAEVQESQSSLQASALISLQPRLNPLQYAAETT